ncbi:SEC-C metal-binding domain-containing protein [Ruminobacter sp. RM87]|uniref:YecA/YgfB family protein n=1 Tax=Ruminobacter sp. RM87 TaxID=1200567 RepID=UPI00055C1E8A|nr:SEC-C metal-binding domain-containing protein [Ruminobacter sp. RM87]
MLQYFIKHRELRQVTYIFKQLNCLKERLLLNNFDDAFKEFESCQVAFNEIESFSKQNNDEQLANSNYVFKCYFMLFCHLMLYFNALKKKNYANSWVLLQDCIDDVRHIGRFAEERLEVTEILKLLLVYESLYPYTFFASPEIVIEKSKCSICGKSMQNLECDHIKGNLYWGKIARAHIEEIKTLSAISIVTHPENKRCVLEFIEESITEVEKFKKIDEFLKLGLPYFQMFKINPQYKYISKGCITKRNEKCPCGSGLKFKKCCGKEMFLKYINYIVKPEYKIRLHFFGV